MNENRKILQWALVISIISAIPYLNTLNAEFTYDDKVAVVGNPDVFLRAPLSDVFTHDFWGNEMFQRSNLTWTHHSYRPLVILTFQFNKWLAGFSTYWIWHATNIFFHAGCTFLVVLIAGLLHSNMTNVIISGLSFAFHPVHTEVTANITSRAETVCGIVVFAMVWLSLREIMHPSEAELVELEPLEFFRKEDQFAINRWYIRRKVWPQRFWTTLLIVTLYVISILCKENALIAPILLLVGEILFNSVVYYPSNKNSKTTNKEKNTVTSKESSGSEIGFIEQVLDTVRNISPIYCIGLIVLAFFAYFLRIRILSGGYELIAPDIHNPLVKLPSRLHRVLSLGFVQTLAFSMLFFPVRLAHEHNALKAITSIWDYRNVLTVGVWVFIGWIFSIAMSSSPASSNSNGKRQISKRERIFYCLGFIIVSYMPASHIFLKVGFVLAERTLFIPSMASVILIPDILNTICSVFAASIANSSWALEVTLEEKEVPVPAEPLEKAPKRPRVSFADSKVKPKKAPTASQNSPAAKIVKKASFGAPEKMVVVQGIAQILRRSFTVLLLGYFFARTWHRNTEWFTEEALLVSSLQTYPEDNFMSMFGLGAKYMYQMKLREAEDLLQKATAWEGIAEPHILLSQIYWRYPHKFSEDVMPKAISHLEKIVESGKKTEFWGNLGLLLWDKATTEEQSKYAEYLVLYSQMGNMLQPKHPWRGALAQNAACTRILSPPRRYGNMDIAVALLEEARILGFDGGHTAYGNSASAAALLGDPHLAKAYLATAIQLAESNPNSSVEHPLTLYKRMAAALEKDEIYNTVKSWANVETSIPGKVAKQRFNTFHGRCQMTLIWF